MLSNLILLWVHDINTLMVQEAPKSQVETGVGVDLVRVRRGEVTKISLNQEFGLAITDFEAEKQELPREKFGGIGIAFDFEVEGVGTGTIRVLEEDFTEISGGKIRVPGGPIEVNFLLTIGGISNITTPTITLYDDLEAPDLSEDNMKITPIENSLPLKIEAHFDPISDERLLNDLSCKLSYDNQVFIADSDFDEVELENLGATRLLFIGWLDAQSKEDSSVYFPKDPKIIEHIRLVISDTVSP